MFYLLATTNVPGEWIGAIGGLMGTIMGGIAAYAAAQAQTRTKEWKEMQDQLQGQLSLALKEQERLREDRNTTLDRMRGEINYLKEQLHDRTFRYKQLQIVNAQLNVQIKQLEKICSDSNPHVKQFIEEFYRHENKRPDSKQ